MAKKKEENKADGTLDDPDRREYLKKFLGESAWDNARDGEIGVIPSSSFSINYITQIGGIPSGRVVQLAGEESSGKTTLCMDIMKHAEDMGYSFLFIDAERSYNAKLAADMGIKTPPEEYVMRESRASLIWSKLIGPHKDVKKQEGILLPDSDIGNYFLNDKKLKLIIIDSINALLVPKVERGDFETQQIGAVSGFLSQNLPLLVPQLAYSGVTLIGIQQLRSKIGVMYGPTETTSGGRAWRHNVSLSIHLRPGKGKDEIIYDNEGSVMGTTVKAVVTKSKVGRPFLEGEYKVVFGKGVIEIEKEIAFWAIKKKVVDRPNNVTYSYEGSSWRGAEAFANAIRDDETLRNKLVEAIHSSRYVSSEMSVEAEMEIQKTMDESELI